MLADDQTQNENIEQNGEITTQQDVIDNPYLRPGKVPKNKSPGTTISGQLSVKRELESWDTLCVISMY